MSLADRLDSLRQAQQPALTQPAPTAPRQNARQAAQDPFASVKASVHQALLESLGPKLYDPHLEESELATRVRHTLQEVIDAEHTARSSRSCAIRRSPRSWSTGRARSTSNAVGRSTQSMPASRRTNTCVALL